MEVGRERETKSGGREGLRDTVTDKTLHEENLRCASTHILADDVFVPAVTGHTADVLLYDCIHLPTAYLKHSQWWHCSAVLLTANC